jgi:hypothetical protein
MWVDLRPRNYRRWDRPLGNVARTSPALVRERPGFPGGTRGQGRNDEARQPRLRPPSELLRRSANPTGERAPRPKHGASNRGCGAGQLLSVEDKGVTDPTRAHRAPWECSVRDSHSSVAAWRHQLADMGSWRPLLARMVARDKRCRFPMIWPRRPTCCQRATLARPEGPKGGNPFPALSPAAAQLCGDR